MKLKKNKGILFWITGLAGSGKTAIANKIKKKISTEFGPTLVVSGDDLRTIFKFKQYSFKERKSLSKKFNKFAKFITNQNINLIFAVVGMFHSMRQWNRKNIDNYVEIYIKSEIKKIIKLKKKKLYHNKNKKNIVGLDIKPELPKNPDIILNNNFSMNLKQIEKVLLKKIKNLIKK